LMPSFEENSHPVAPNYLVSMLSHGEDPESLSHLALNPYRVVTDRQTDRQTEFPYGT